MLYDANTYTEPDAVSQSGRWSRSGSSVGCARQRLVMTDPAMAESRPQYWKYETY